ncbi:winged helix-turn-helix domain-containing protein [Eggerthella sp. YY7918]|uniref:winged helix-turn-helix domain-containing protein n=1 Tax=Eggerthella sp. (strain YY7918) TaxID=502558 RepID=UPI000A06AF6C
MVMLKTSESRARGLEENLSPDSEINSEINLDSQILALISSHPKITQPQVAARLGMTPKQVEYRYQKLKKSGKIIRVGSRKAGHWAVLDE